MALSQEKREQVARILERFLLDRMRTIRKIRLEDLTINPFLIRLLANEMGFQDSETIIHWLVSQRALTGTNTSFGFALQKIAKIFSEGSGVEGADIMKTKNGRHYHIQVKSGPATMDKDAVTRISQLLQSAQRRNQGSIALIGMCYGNKSQVYSTIKLYSQVDWLIGREFWEFISDDPDCIEEIYNIAFEVGSTFRDVQGKTLSEVMDDKVKKLKEEFDNLFGSGNEMWNNLLEKNS